MAIISRAFILQGRKQYISKEASRKSGSLFKTIYIRMSLETVINHSTKTQEV